MDMDALMTKQGMRDWTDEQRDTWVTDAMQMRQLAQIITARLANQHIDGDSTRSAARRARKVTAPLRRAAGLLEKAAAQMEAMNARHGREVLELPARRAKELERKQLRRQRLGVAETAINQSLTTSAAALHGTPVGNPQVTPVQDDKRYVSPQPWQFPGQPAGAQPVPDISEVFEGFGREAM